MICPSAYTQRVETLVQELRCSSLCSNPCTSITYLMFRIPDILYRHKKEAYLAYRPNGFSIGPWHAGESYVEASQKIKDMYLQVVLDRFLPSAEIYARLYVAVMEVEQRARNCYAEPVNMGKEEFVHMLVRNSCFLVELLSRYYKIGDHSHYTSPSKLTFQFTYHDLILLENQLPWFVLKIVFDMIGRCEEPLQVLVTNFFSVTCSHTRGNITCTN